MKPTKILVLFFIPLLFSGSFENQESIQEEFETKWSGTVSFYEKKTGSEGLNSEWRMFASVSNDTGTAVHYSYVTSIHGWSRCRTTEKTLLEVGIDEETKTYSISVNVPGCYGRQVIQGQESSYAVSDETAIVITNPRLPQNLNVLTGSTVETYTHEFGTTTTIYEWNLRKPCPPWNNALTQTNIATLDPAVKVAATRFIKRVNDELCIKLKVASAYRTIDEQNEIYAIGRDKNGKVIGKTFTNAPGGQSNHNFKRAIDVYYATATGIDVDKVLSKEIVEIAKQEGFEWGGDWFNLKDYPHFEMKR